MLQLTHAKQSHSNAAPLTLAAVLVTALLAAATTALAGVLGA